MIGLRILGRDSCTDDIAEYFNIGESTVGPILKKFVDGYLYHKHVYVPVGAELDQVRLVYEKLALVQWTVLMFYGIDVRRCLETVVHVFDFHFLLNVYSKLYFYIYRQGK